MKADKKKIYLQDSWRANVLNPIVYISIINLQKHTDLKKKKYI